MMPGRKGKAATACVVAFGLSLVGRSAALWNDSQLGWSQEQGPGLVGAAVRPRNFTEGCAVAPKFVGEGGRIPDILFVKTAKTGGSTLGGIVRRIVAHNGGDAREYTAAIREQDMFARRGGSGAQEPGVVHMWANHAHLTNLLGWYTDQADSRVLARAFKLSIVRHPVDQCRSMIYYWHATGRLGPVDTPPTLASKLSVVPICEGSMKMMRPFLEATPSQVLDFYDLVGVTGRFVESVSVLKILLGLSYKDVLYISAKRADGTRFEPKPEEEDEDPRVLEAIRGREDFQDQMEMWEHANHRLDAWIAQLQPQFAQVNATLTALGEAAQDRCWKDYKKDCYWADAGCASRCLDALADEFVYVHGCNGERAPATSATAAAVDRPFSKP